MFSIYCFNLMCNIFIKHFYLVIYLYKSTFDLAIVSLPAICLLSKGAFVLFYCWISDKLNTTISTEKEISPTT